MIVNKWSNGNSSLLNGEGPAGDLDDGRAGAEVAREEVGVEGGRHQDDAEVRPLPEDAPGDGYDSSLESWITNTDSLQKFLWRVSRDSWDIIHHRSKVGYTSVQGKTYPTSSPTLFSR